MRVTGEFVGTHLKIGIDSLKAIDQRWTYRQTFAVLIIHLLPLIQIKNLTVEFPETDSADPALQHIDLELNRGEMLAVVGESGSGQVGHVSVPDEPIDKSARVVEGPFYFHPTGGHAIDLLTLPEKKFRGYRGNQTGDDFPGAHDFPESGDDLRGAAPGTPDAS